MLCVVLQLPYLWHNLLLLSLSVFFKNCKIIIIMFPHILYTKWFIHLENKMLMILISVIWINWTFYTSRMFLTSSKELISHTGVLKWDKKRQMFLKPLIHGTWWKYDPGKAALDFQCLLLPLPSPPPLLLNTADLFPVFSWALASTFSLRLSPPAGERQSRWLRLVVCRSAFICADLHSVSMWAYRL